MRAVKPGSRRSVRSSIVTDANSGMSPTNDLILTGRRWPSGVVICGRVRVGKRGTGEV